MAGVEGGLFCAGIFERESNGTLPRGFGDVVVSEDFGVAGDERKH
jgi:hypothetical protein